MSGKIDHKAVWGSGYHAGYSAAVEDNGPWIEVCRSGQWSYQKRGRRKIVEHLPDGYWVSVGEANKEYSTIRHVAEKGWANLEDFLFVYLRGLSELDKHPDWCTATWLAREIHLSIEADRLEREYRKPVEPMRRGLNAGTNLGSKETEG